MKLVVVLLAAVAVLGVGAGAAAGTGPGGPEEMPIIDPAELDGCGSEPVDVDDPNYDGSCDPVEAVELMSEFSKTLEGVAVRCRTIEERITYRATLGRNKIWDYVQQVEWCWNGITIRRISRIRFPRLSFAGGIYWDFKGHTASSCEASGGYSPCSEQAGRSNAYIATQGKFQTITCGVKIFCITKLPGMWVRITAAGKVSGYGSL